MTCIVQVTSSSMQLLKLFPPFNAEATSYSKPETSPITADSLSLSPDSRSHLESLRILWLISSFPQASFLLGPVDCDIPTVILQLFRSILGSRAPTDNILYPWVHELSFGTNNWCICNRHWLIREQDQGWQRRDWANLVTELRKVLLLLFVWVIFETVIWFCSDVLHFETFTCHSWISFTFFLGGYVHVCVCVCVFSLFVCFYFQSQH